MQKETSGRLFSLCVLQLQYLHDKRATENTFFTTVTPSIEAYFLNMFVSNTWGVAHGVYKIHFSLKSVSPSFKDYSHFCQLVFILDEAGTIFSTYP